MNKILIKLFSLSILISVFTSCTDDLNRYPTNGLTSNIQYDSISGYKQGLATVYGLSDNNGPNWEGGLLRSYFTCQEVSTDEAKGFGNDPFNTFLWSTDNSTLLKMYTTLMYNITITNNYLIESEPSTVSQRGFSAVDAATISTYRAEARYMRALYYWMLMDLYGNPPFATEETLKKSAIPTQIKRADLFKYIESELLNIENNMVDPKQNEYGRADKAAVWSLLSRLYLNGEVYTGNKYYTQAITYCNKVIGAGYSLEKKYSWLFLGDNNLCTNEFIQSIPFDNSKIITWEGTNYFALGPSGVPESINGLSGSWLSFVMSPQVVNLFPSTDTLIDKRAIMYTVGRKNVLNSLVDDKQGIPACKYRNVTRAGVKIVQNSSNNNISDIDFPIFRLPEIYLTYAEAVLRGGLGGDLNTALGYINKIRGRAYANNPNSTLGNITLTQLTLPFIMDERARELYWECLRRTDLVRFGKFTSSDYLWAFKGGIIGGKGVSDIFNIYPLPSNDVLANPNLTQNPGY